MMFRMVLIKASIPHEIIQVEMGATPIVIETCSRDQMCVSPKESSKRQISWQRAFLDKGCHSETPYQEKVSLWQMVVGGLPVGSHLQREKIAS